MRFRDILTANQFFALLAKGLEGSKSIIANVVIARGLGPEFFGRYAFVIGVITLIAVIAEFRLQSILVKRLSNHDGHPGLIIGSAMGVNLIFSLVGLVLVFFYATIAERDASVAAGLIIYSVIFFFKIPRAFRAYYLSIEQNVLVAKCEAIASVVTLSAILLTVYLEGGLRWLLAARALDFLVVSIFLVIFYRRMAKGPESALVFNSSTAKSLATQAAPLVASGAAMILFQRVDVIIVRDVLGDRSAGIYGSATTTMLLFSLLPLVVSETLAPRMFRHSSSNSIKAVKQKYSDIIVRLGILMSLAMALTGTLIGSQLFGAEYEGAKYSILILSLSPLLIALGGSSGQLIVADGNQNKSFIKSLIACAVTLLMNLTLVPIMGIEGAALSTIVGLAVANYFSHFFVNPYRYLFQIQTKSLLVFRSSK